MKDAQRSIFREEAVRRYIESKEKAVLPKLISPHTFAYLWILLGLLLSSSLSAWFVRVPIYASGSAIVTRLNSNSNEEANEKLNTRMQHDDEIVVAAFFPSQYHSNLQAAQAISLEFDAMSDRFTRSILTVEPTIMSPDAIQNRYSFNKQTTPLVTQPATVAIVQLPTSKDLPASAYLGSVGHAQAEIGSQRLATLLPLIGQLFNRESNQI